MKKADLTVVVLGGGDSPEREVSLRSSLSVEKAIQKAGFRTLWLDPKVDHSKINNLDPNTNIVFPILHGQGGEDGSIQEVLENSGIQFLGTGSKASKIAFDKAETRSLLEQHQIPVAEGGVVTPETYGTYELSSKPHVLKVTTGGSSLGTLLVKESKVQSQLALEAVFKYGEQAVIEELVEGMEITVPILDTKALPVIEIIPPKDGEFDYENKYNGATKEICPPQTLSEELQGNASALAEKVHKVVGCRHLSRVDVIVRPDGSMVVLEINTIPGMTDQSLYPKSADVAGLTFPELMKSFVKMVTKA